MCHLCYSGVTLMSTGFWIISMFPYLCVFLKSTERKRGTLNHLQDKVMHSSEISFSRAGTAAARPSHVLSPGFSRWLHVGF